MNWNINSKLDKKSVDVYFYSIDPIFITFEVLKEEIEQDLEKFIRKIFQFRIVS